jgi:quinol-cytochrome oxidoreductase complex cytochrome b subunit
MAQAKNIGTLPQLNLGFRFLTLKVPHHTQISVIGIALLFIFIIQLLSGIMVGLSLTSDPLMIPMSRNEEDMEDLYTDDFFWVHERGVDLIFIFIYIHVLRKFQIGSFNTKQEGA